MTSATVTDTWISEIESLTLGECERVRKGLDDMRPHWIQRHPKAPFYTLGASNYFDIAFNPMLPYYRFAALFNPVMREHLGWMYDRVAERLSAHFDEPVAYREGLALPGFHILLADKSFESAQDLTHLEWFRAKGNAEIVGNAIHCDTAHQVVNWGTREGIDFENPISITLSIALPASGAGLNYWDFGKEKTEGMPQKDLLDLLLASDKHYHAYRLGSMVVHSGLRYHQMAPMRELIPTDERITLQGHGLRCNGTWQLFW
jgi:hypothetical protein